MEGKEELKNFLKCGKFSFYVMIDREIFTYLKIRIVWDNPFGVDVSLTEKPSG